jgi:purine-nucleoside phosphorylase
VTDPIQQAAQFIQDNVPTRPRIACILGSGLGDFAETISSPFSISASDIPHYPVSSISGHAGKLVFGEIRAGLQTSLPLLVFQGRVHFYESNSLDTTIFPTRVAHALGAEYLIVTNAAGGINRSFRPGDLMLIRDTLDLTFLRRQHKSQSRHGATNYFDSSLQSALRTTASDLGVRLQEGTYCWLKGPSYETAAEIEMLRRLGADAVGMSTVPEIVTAASLGMKVVGISLISNLATGITGEKLSHEEVTDTANLVKQKFTQLMSTFLLTVER